MKRNHCLIALASLLVLVSSGSPAHAFVQSINVGNFAFTPQTTTITLGDTLRWVWVNGVHTATSGDPTTCVADGTFSGPLDSGHTSFQYVPAQSGTLDYFCMFHCSMGMNGHITVQPNPAASPEKGVIRASESLLLSISPNPVTTHASITLRVPTAEPVRVEIFDLTGRAIATIADREFEAGSHPLTWDGRTAEGTTAVGGIYYATAASTTESAVARLLVVR